MEFITQFMEKALNTEGSFSIRSDRKTISYHFLQDHVGKAKYVYFVREWGEEMFYFKTHLCPELFAIVVDETVYILNYNILYYNETGLRREGELPENVINFETTVKDINRYAKEVIFPEFYNSLIPDDITDPEDIKECIKCARYSILQGMEAPFTKAVSEISFFDEDKTAAVLCGFMDRDTEIKRLLKAEKGKWTAVKSRNQKIGKLMQNPETAAEWEIRLAEGIRNADAKHITVEFEFDGKHASEKISTDTVLIKLINQDGFNYYNFITRIAGCKLFEYFGIDGWKNTIYCRNITKITYGKKTLYERRENENA